MKNCRRQWYCNECLDENMRSRHEFEQKRRQKQQHQHKKKKGYTIMKFQNEIECNLVLNVINQDQRM